MRLECHTCTTVFDFENSTVADFLAIRVEVLDLNEGGFGAFNFMRENIGDLVDDVGLAEPAPTSNHFL